MKIDNKGFTSIGMVIILFLLGSILLIGLSHILLSWQRTFVYEKQYYHQFNQAFSSIQWGATLNWSEPTTAWQCQSEVTYQLYACIKQSSLSKNSFVIIRGGKEASLFHYHLAIYHNGKLNIQKGHWLDYCPENRESLCD